MVSFILHFCFFPSFSSSFVVFVFVPFSAFSSLYLGLTVLTSLTVTVWCIHHQVVLSIEVLVLLMYIHWSYSISKRGEYKTVSLTVNKFHQTQMFSGMWAQWYVLIKSNYVLNSQWNGMSVSPSFPVCLSLFLIDSLGMVVVFTALKALSSPIQWMWRLEWQQTVLNHTKLAHPPCAATKTPINMQTLAGAQTFT